MHLYAIQMVIVLILILSPIVVFGLNGTSSAAGIELANGNETKYAISLAADATLPEKNAANELASYLGKVTGAKFDIFTPEEAAGKPTIAVGPGAALKVDAKLNLEKAELGDDGIVVKTDGTNVVLTGGLDSRRGTLYAVYEFLESVVGVRWWTHTEETIPNKPKLTIDRLDIRYVPQFKFRQMYCWSTVHHVDSHWHLYQEDERVKDWDKVKFCVKTRNNGYGSAIPASYGGSIMPLGWCHTFYNFIKPEDHFENHPEWFSEIDGKRTAENGQLCMTNDEMLEVLAANVITRIDEQPHFTMVAVSQMDNGTPCSCEKCANLDKAEGSQAASLLYGINRVAELVEKKHPEVEIITLAYQYSIKPPKTIRPRKNVVMQVAFDARSFFQVLDSDTNREVFNNLKVWSGIGAKIQVWDYYLNYKGPLTLHPNIYTIGPDIRQCRDHNATGVFLEDESVATNYFIALKTYLASHLLWDPLRDSNALIKEFLNGYYGEAAESMHRALDVFENAASKVTRWVWPGSPDAGWMTLDDMNRATTYFDQAEELVKNDKVLLARVKRARIPLDHQWLYGYKKYIADYNESGGEFLGPKDPVAAAAVFKAFVMEEFSAMKPSMFVSYMKTRSDEEYLDALAERAAN